MNRTTHHVCVAVILTVLAITAYAPDDLKQRNNNEGVRWCEPCSHDTETPPGGCPHRQPRTPGMCWTNGGQGVRQCPEQTTETACVASTPQAYEVKNDFPQTEGDNASSVCITDTTGGPTAQSMWIAHTYVVAPAANCYRTVQCQWNSTSRKCEIKAGSEGPWVDLPKRNANPCSPCLP